MFHESHNILSNAENPQKKTKKEDDQKHNKLKINNTFRSQPLTQAMFYFLLSAVICIIISSISYFFHSERFHLPNLFKDSCN